MKHFTLFMQLIAIVLLLNSVSTQAAIGQTDTVTILHFNDTHANLSPGAPRDAALKGTVGGIARAATLIGLTRMEAPNTLVLHAGDAFVGDMFFNKYVGIAELQLLNALGVDAMAVGNHEFDLTPATLTYALATAFPSGGFPLLSANTILANDSLAGLREYVHPFTVKHTGAVTVGIFGLTTPSANVTSLPSPAVISEDIVTIASAMVDSLTARHCTLIICLSHLGASLDSVIAQSVPGIHVIVGGHDHYTFDTPHTVLNPLGKPTYLVQANAFYLTAGRLRLAVSADDVHIINYAMVPLDASIPEEPTVAATVDSLIADIESVYGPLFTQQIGTATDDFEEEVKQPMGPGPKDTPVGHLVTDAFRAATGTDIAIEVGGSTAQILHKGPIVADDIFRVIGYGFNETNGMGFRLATFHLTGASLIAALETCLSMSVANDEFLPQVSGMTYAYDTKAADGARVAADKVFVGSRRLDPGAVYSVTSNELAAAFLPTLGIELTDVRTTGDTTEMQVVAAYVAALGTISPSHDHRIDRVKITIDRSEAVPKEFRLDQNFPNPFNPSTTIVFDCPTRADVSLKVFTILGQEINTIIDGRLGAGTYTVSFDGSGLSSGAYLYRLHADRYTETKKMLLVR